MTMLLRMFICCACLSSSSLCLTRLAAMPADSLPSTKWALVSKVLTASSWSRVSTDGMRSSMDRSRGVSRIIGERLAVKKRDPAEQDHPRNHAPEQAFVDVQVQLVAE